MKSPKTVIPMGMVHKKHYCHKCAEQLVKYPRTLPQSEHRLL